MVLVKSADSSPLIRISLDKGSVKFFHVTRNIILVKISISSVLESKDVELEVIRRFVSC